MLVNGEKSLYDRDMPSVAFVEIEEWEKNFLSDHLVGQEIIFSSDPLEPERSIDPKIFDCEVLSPFIYSQLTAQMLSKFSNLKYIATRSTGYDHIDLNYCKEKKIIVSNVPSYGVHGVAEHAFSLILALAKHIIPSIEQTRRGNFTTAGLTGFELYGKTIGIIGAGKIGTSVANIAKGFGMNMLLYSHHADPAIEALGGKFVDLETLLKSSDIITLHVPLTDETKHMINTNNITLCKKGSIIINTARGGIVETAAILEGLQTGILAGAGLDVLEEECNVKEERELLSKEFVRSCDLQTQLMDHMLLNRDDVIVTPHNAFNTKESLEEILQTTVANIDSFTKGNPQNIIQ